MARRRKTGKRSKPKALLHVSNQRPSGRLAALDSGSNDDPGSLSRPRARTGTDKSAASGDASEVLRKDSCSCSALHEQESLRYTNIKLVILKTTEAIEELKKGLTTQTPSCTSLEIIQARHEALYDPDTGSCVSYTQSGQRSSAAPNSMSDAPPVPPERFT